MQEVDQASIQDEIVQINANTRFTWPDLRALSQRLQHFMICINQEASHQLHSTPIRCTPNPHIILSSTDMNDTKSNYRRCMRDELSPRFACNRCFVVCTKYCLPSVSHHNLTLQHTFRQAVVVAFMGVSQSGNATSSNLHCVSTPKIRYYACTAGFAPIRISEAPHRFRTVDSLTRCSPTTSPL